MGFLDVFIKPNYLSSNSFFLLCVIIKIFLANANIFRKCEYDRPNEISGFLPFLPDLLTHTHTLSNIKKDLPGCHVINGAFYFMKYQIVSHTWKLNIEISFVKLSLNSKVLIQSRFFEEATLCKSKHSFCTQSCFLNETLNFLMTFLTMDESWPILGSASFYQILWGYITTCYIDMYFWSLWFLTQEDFLSRFQILNWSL